MRVVICTAHGVEYTDLAAITFPSLQAYCKKHGYFLAYDSERTDKDACKVAMYQQVYSSGQFTPDDVFVWVDTDAVIMNSERRITSIVYEHMPQTVHYLIGTDVNGINSGVFIARFSPQAHLFMTIANNVSVVSGWADQIGIAQTSLMEPHRSIYKEVSGAVFNCNLYSEKGWNLGEYGKYINEYIPGESFILHLAGVPEPARSSLLKEYSERAT